MQGLETVPRRTEAECGKREDMSDLANARAHNLGQVLEENCRAFPDSTAVVDGTLRMSWPELADRVLRLTNALAQEGFGMGDRLLWMGQSSSRILECLLAVGNLGGMLCPVNWRQSAAELTFVLQDFDPKIVVWQEEEVGERVREARQNWAGNALWLLHDSDGEGSYESFLATGMAVTDTARYVVDGELPVLVIYTAAFSGRPNGAMLSHNGLILQSAVVAMLSELDHGVVYLNSGPMFHIGNFLWMLPTFLLGGKNVFIRRVEAQAICELIDAENCTSAFLQGPTIGEMQAINRDGRYNLKSLRVSMFLDVWGNMATLDQSPFARYSGGFGQTEVSGLASFGAFGFAGIGNSGRSSPFGTLRILDEEGCEVPQGESGEIVVRGPMVGLGYWNRPQMNAQRVRGGWWHTTDLGRREADGSITFLGTTMRTIKSAAENIYPSEVEACLESHPDIMEAAVIGGPDSKWRQSVKAVIVVRQGAALTADDVIEHCKRHIASYKKPRTVEVVEVLPRQGYLKDYQALDERFGGGAYVGGSDLDGGVRWEAPQRSDSDG